MFDSPLGFVAVVMIGATSVGKISVTYDSFISNTAGTDKTAVRSYDPPIDIAAGDLRFFTPSCRDPSRLRYDRPP